MLLELHAHSVRHSSCSGVEPIALVQQALRKGLQGIVLTEHHYQWPADELRQLAVEAGTPPYFQILSGQEVDTDIGHVIVLGADRSITERTPIDALRKRYPAAALIWAHPFRNGREPSDSQLSDPRLDAVEILSLNHSPRENYRGLRRWHELRFTATCGSDAHSRDMAGVFPTQFDHPATTMGDIAHEIKCGRCRPLVKEIPKAGSDMTVTEVTIGTKGEDEQRQRIVTRNITDPRRWDQAKATAGITTLLHDSAFSEGTYRVPKVIDVIDNEHLIIEEGQRGNDLFTGLCCVPPAVGKRYFELAAEWLARLHSRSLHITGPQETRDRENWRFANYESSWALTNDARRRELHRLLSLVKTREEELLSGRQESFVQCHGDYHPKNIFISQDRARDPSTLYVSVIDFNNSMLFLPEFDVGYFLAQFRSQFMNFGAIREQYSDDLFLSAYMKSVLHPIERRQFLQLVDFFKLRAFLSIGSYFIRIGKGESSEMEFVVAEASALTEKQAVQ